MDSHAFASLAHVQILLLPVGSIQQSAFDKFAAEIRAFDDIRLGDIPADQKDERARFMPNPMSTGYLHLSFPSHPPPSTHSSLALFRPSHFPLGVIGIGVCSPTESLPSILDQFNALLFDIFPASSLFPLAKNCFVFEESDSSPNLNLGDNLPGLVVIPSMMGNKKLYVGTLLADLCSHILGEFGRVVQALESPFGNEYLNSTLFPPMPTLSDMPRQFEDGFQSHSLPPLPSHNSQPDVGVSTLRAQTNLKRNSSAGHGLSNATNSNNIRHSTLVVPTTKNKRNSGIGVASSPGRLFKVLGDFFLLSGRIDDAAVWYTESIIVLKTAQDLAWHASALEGLATAAVLEAWLSGHGLAGSFSNTKEPWIDISEKLAQATTLYYKTTPPLSESEQNHFYLSYLYSTAAIRHASLFFSIWSAKGWGPLAFTTMLQPGANPYLPPTLSHAEHNTLVNLERLSFVSGISRSMVAGLLAQAHGPWLLHLGPRERLEILETMAAIYACLGYERKEAYVLREVIGCIMDLLVCGREESRGSAKPSPRSSGTGLGIRGVDFGDKNPSTERGNVGVRANDSVEGNESILRLLKYVCRVLGIDLEAVKLVNTYSDEPSAGDEEQEKSRSTVSPLQLDEDILDMTQDIYGWPELQVGVVREAIAVAESLPDYPTVAQIALSALKTMHPVLTTGDQHHLYTTSVRALTTAQRRGDTRQIEYWAGRPIISVAVSPLPFVRLPIEKPMSILTARLSGLNPILTGATDPFLYNPRKSSTVQGKTLVVQNEPLELVITLRNPFVFDLDIQNLALSTSGVPFDAKNVSVIIPASSYRVVSIVGKPLRAGNLVIRGCVVQAPGGTSREFILPLSTDDEEARLSRRRSALECEAGRSKYCGLDSRPWKRGGKRVSASVSSNMKPSRFLECKVVPEQPLLRIRRTSLTHGAVMMYNGEMSTLRLTLENVSTLPIDFLRLSFDDSTIGPAQQALADGQLSVFDTYETEYDLIHRPTFTWQSQEEFKGLAPGQKVVVTVVCFGKVGCTSGTIFVAYSHVHRPIGDAEASSEVFHTRQLTYPVLVTVYHMLECHGMDILPFDGIQANDSIDGETAHVQSSLLSIDEAGWCLFSVEVRNTYGLPFEVTFERDQDGTQKASTSLVVPPGSMSRIVLPIKKFLLSEDQISQPIPTLSDRQFVVTKTNLSSAQENNQRELFWYREELFKIIRGHWLEVGGTRTGDLSLRQQRMTLPMLETIRTETARVTMSLVGYEDESGSTKKSITQKGGKFLPLPNEFVYVRTRVINLSPSPLVLLVSLDFDPADHIIYDGALSNIPLGQMESGEAREVETALCFLSQGQFEICAEVQILGASRNERKAGVGQLKAVVREET